VVSRRRALSADLVLRRHLSAGPLPLGGGAGGPVSQSGHTLDRVGLRALPAAGGLQRRDTPLGRLPALGAAPPGLPVPAGARQLGRPRLVRGAGVCERWTDAAEPGEGGAAALARAIESGLPQVTGRWSDGLATYPFAAVLPLLQREQVMGALVLVGEARDPFTA